VLKSNDSCSLTQPACPSGETRSPKDSICYANSGFVEERMQSMRRAPEACPVGNPIQVTTAAKLHAEASGVEVGEQELIFFYRSDKAIQAAAAGRAVTALGASPVLGGHWESSFHRQLHLPGIGLSAQLYRGDGHTINFQFDPTNKVYVADAGSSYSLTYSGGVFRVTSREGFVETYNVAGKILNYEDVGGNQLTFSYSSAATTEAPAAGFLVEVKDQYARAAKFAYDSNGRLVRVTDASTRVLELSYNGNGLLDSIEWPDAQVKSFLYESGAFPNALTGIVDERGTRISTYAYDGMGRATSTERAGGVNHFVVSYGSPPGVSSQMETDPVTGHSIRRQSAVAPQGTTVTAPNGQVNEVGTALIDGVTRVTSSTQPAGSGCAAATSQSSYNGVGNPVVIDNFSGERSCMAYDSIHRVTTRIDGLATSVVCANVLPSGSTLPAGARRTDHEWHSDWNLQTKLTQPGSVTTNIYQGMPDPTAGNAQANCSATPNMSNGKPLPLVCKINVVADGASGGPSITLNTSRTYDRRGRLVTQTDEKGRVSNYSYHTSNSLPGMGDQFIQDVTILMKGEGANGSSAFVNSAPHNVTTQAVGGSAHITTSSAAFGAGSMSFAGANNSSPHFVRVDNAKMSTFWASDWTVEARLKPILTGGYSDPMAFFGAWGTAEGASIYVTSTNGTLNALRVTGFEGASGIYFDTGVGISNHVAGEWATVAVTKEGTTYRYFLNGVLLRQETRAQNIRNFSSNSAWIGAAHNSFYPYPYRGLIDELRVTINNARYTQGYSVATAEFSASAWNPALYQPNDVGVTPFDLAGITNAAGHVTQYTQYDRAGRVRQMVDAKGVVTDISYTPRGWVSTVVATPPGGSARTTSYSYDAVGQVTGVSQPDGSTLSYSYDAAQRLVGVTDAKGNAVSYTLDNMGNRVGEEIKDPAGVLRRGISRSFDALNRLQQATGSVQ
jgi:YD repeat-containing protein